MEGANDFASLKEVLGRRYAHALKEREEGITEGKFSDLPDLILLDYEMPVTPGPKVMEMLRSESTTKDIPVIFLTGKSDKESVVQVLNLKPEGYILKSVTQNELIEKIAEFFSKRLK